MSLFTSRTAVSSLFLAASLAVLSATGCSSTVEAIDRSVDCDSICSRYADCFDRNYDESACKDRCVANSKQDTDYRRKADTCEACITDRDCTAATFKCATECSSIVP